MTREPSGFRLAMAMGATIVAIFTVLISLVAVTPDSTCRVEVIK